MTASFKLSGDELNEAFLQTLRQMFAKKEIEIIVYETEIDETDRIRENPELHAKLMEASRRADLNDGLIEIDLNKFS